MAEYNEFMAQIFEANAKQSADAHNRVIENAEQERDYAARLFVELWNAVANTNLKVDSLRIDSVLSRYEAQAAAISQALERRAS